MASTQPSTYTVVVCRNIKEDIAFAESRIRAETIAAEDILHDMGAISMMSSDSQAMGRIGEVVARTWQTADKMRRQRGRLPEEKGDNDNYRVRRYIAKYTVNPAVAQGIDQKGKLADLVIWRPRFFGVRPESVIKGGQMIWNRMGLANASIPTPQPILQRKMFGFYGRGPSNNSLIFVSKVNEYFDFNVSAICSEMILC
ncbi:hypothetical protein LAZ67_21001150 [Cordylochernes scorpioides]|uniref:urease n=1 Tax=Cordylochernes scorpioides TaxID=51811 RepID=A0ABY6LLS9_9ARAC|nr:hypothetical protein LAZ67_21001150 [Cordylochernes scorpioides]